MTLLRSRNFALLWIARLISIIGDWLLDIALPVWVYQITESPLALGTMVAVQQVPGVLLSPVAGVLVDRWDRRRVLASTYALLGLVLPLLFLVHTPDQISIVYLVGLLNGLLGAFVFPARGTLLPNIVERDRLMQANSLLAVTGQALMFIGPALGGAVLAWTGPQTIFLLDMISFFVASLLVSAIHLQPTAEYQTAATTQSGIKGVLQDMREGLDVLCSRRVLWGVLSVWSILIFAGGAVTAVLVVFVREALSGQEATYGYLLSMQGLGMFIGGGATMTMGRRALPIPIIVGGLFAFAAVFFIGANISSIPVAAFLVCMLGMLMAAVGISQSTLTQEVTPDAFRGRVQATNGTVTALMMLLGALAGGLLAEEMGVRVVFNAAALLSLVAAIVAFFVLRPPTILNEDVTRLHAIDS